MISNNYIPACRSTFQINCFFCPGEDKCTYKVLNIDFDNNKKGGEK